MLSDENMKEVNAQIENLFLKIVNDKNINSNEKMSISRTLENFKLALNEYSKITQNDKDLAKEYELKLGLESLIEKVKLRDFDYHPSYIPQFIKAISKSPYTLPSTLFELDGKTKVKIRITNRKIKEENIGLALSLLFPGSITYRYNNRIKIKCGDFSKSLKAHLHSLHILSEKPIFDIVYNSIKKPVFEPLILNSVEVERNQNTHQYYVCSNCISLSDNDEDCEHIKSPRNKTPFSKVRTIKRYISSKEVEHKIFVKPLRDIVEKVTLVDELKVGIAAVGFERGMDKKTLFIEYEPFIGQLLITKGLRFSIKEQSKRIKKIINKYIWIQRDIILQILANKFLAILKQNRIPEYEFERLFSLLIELLKKDYNYCSDLHEINNILSDFEELYSKEIQKYNERNEIKIIPNKNLDNLMKNFSQIKIEYDSILEHANETYIHTLSHLILIACCITSGSEFNDIDYTIDQNEIIIFDKTSGGNGVTDLVFEFLSKEEEFELEKEIRKEFEKSTIMNPRYFDSIFFELLLPCMNSVVERIFFTSEEKTAHYEFTKRWQEIDQRFKNREQLKDNIKKLSVENSYPYINSITEDFSEEIDDLDMELIKEAIDICIHGCPECSVLGNQCHYGNRLEKFNISKLFQSLVFENVIKNYISCDKIEDDTTIEKIKSSLTKLNISFLRLQYSQYNPSDIEEFILSVSGMELDDSFIKNCGQWFDVNINDGTLIIYIMFRTKR